MLLLSAAFSKLTFSKNSFVNTIKVSICLDPVQDRRSGSKLFAKVISRRLIAADKERVKFFTSTFQDLKTIFQHF